MMLCTLRGRQGLIISVPEVLVLADVVAWYVDCCLVETLLMPICLKMIGSCRQKTRSQWYANDVVHFLRDLWAVTRQTLLVVFIRDDSHIQTDFGKESGCCPHTQYCPGQLRKGPVIMSTNRFPDFALGSSLTVFMEIKPVSLRWEQFKAALTCMLSSIFPRIQALFRKDVKVIRHLCLVL